MIAQDLWTAAMKARFNQLRSEVEAIVSREQRGQEFFDRSASLPPIGGKADGGVPQRRQERRALISPLGSMRRGQDLGMSMRGAAPPPTSAAAFDPPALSDSASSSGSTAEAASMLLSLSPQHSPLSGQPTPPLSALLEGINSPELLGLAQLATPSITGLDGLTGLDASTSPLGELLPAVAETQSTSLFFDRPTLSAPLGGEPRAPVGITDLLLEPAAARP